MKQSIVDETKAGMAARAYVEKNMMGKKPQDNSYTLLQILGIGILKYFRDTKQYWFLNNTIFQQYFQWYFLPFLPYQNLILLELHCQLHDFKEITAGVPH